MTPAASPLVIRTLAGSRWSKVGRFAMKRLREAVGDPVRLVVHTDGTVTAEQRADWEAWAGPLEWIDGPVVEDAMGVALRDHPRCAAFRARHPLARKLFDVIVLAEDGEAEVVYVDTDVQWLRHCGKWLRQPLPPGVDGRFSSQPVGDEAVAAWPLDLRPLGSLRLAARINTGVFRVRRGVLDLDRIEAALAVLERRRRAVRREFWLEQTLWAVLAGAARTERWAFDAITIPPADDRLAVPESGVSAIHCVGPVRLAFWRYKHHRLGDELSPAIEPARILRPGALLLSDLRRIGQKAPAAAQEG